MIYLINRLNIFSTLVTLDIDLNIILLVTRSLIEYLLILDTSPMI